MNSRDHNPTDVSKHRSLSSLQPSAHLPALSTIDELPMEERQVALAGWTAWVNSNRDKLAPLDERLLDRALEDLERSTTAGADNVKIDEQFDNWLDGVLHRNDEQL